MLKIVVMVALFALIFLRWSCIYAIRRCGQIVNVQRMTYIGMITDMVIAIIIVLML